jgi:hypothetical protein
VITEGKRQAVRVARPMRFTPATRLVCDRGSADSECFHRLTRPPVHCVTRLQDNADYGVVEERERPRRKGVLRDPVIFFYKRWGGMARSVFFGGGSSGRKHTIAVGYSGPTR